MKRAEWFEKKWYYLRRLGYFALGGLVLIPIYHWKDRYVGGHNNLWGALLVIETSGWSKVIYWFRHIFPDRARTGRYANVE